MHLPGGASGVGKGLCRGLPACGGGAARAQYSQRTRLLLQGSHGGR